MSNIANKENAAEIYIKRVSEIQEMLTKLKNTTEEFFERDPYLVNWGHVGDVNYIADQLREICDRVYKEGEHAL